MVMLLHAQAEGHVQRLVLCPHGDAGIALLLRVIPVIVVSGEVQLDLPFLKLCLLDAEGVGVQVVEDIQKVFAGAGPEAVHIP